MAMKLAIKIEDYDNGGYKHLLVDAVMLPDIGNVPHFACRNPKLGEYFLVVEYETGAYASRGWSIGAALTVAEANIKAIGEAGYRKKLAGVTEQFGNANAGPIPAAKGHLYRDIEKELNDLVAAELATETGALAD